MLVAIISDSHYALEAFGKLLSHLEEKNIRHLIHAGDFIIEGVEELLSRHPEMRFYIARGNCDMNRPLLNRLGESNRVLLSDVAHFELEGVSFGVSHIEGHAENDLRGKRVDVFIHGHTHRPKIDRKNGLLTLNPGSLMDGDGYMLLETASLEVSRKFDF